MKQVTTIQNKLTDIWSYTELEMSDFSTVGLKKHLAKISEIVNDVICDLEDLNNCTVCRTEVCDTCLDDMAKELG
jgi:hypothetical protein|tara:strand:+ start:305 stop:529 length:225 start_codon:yes stop_codon:yes gene_type:complete